MKVVIADDEKIARDGLKSVIDWPSFNMEVVYCAENGKKALDYIKNNEVDILITDIRMPELDGLELIKNIFLLNIKTNVIILSGYKDFTYAQKAIRYGVSDYLLKPIHIEELEGVLKKINEKHREDFSNIYVDKKEKERYNAKDKHIVKEEREKIKRSFKDLDLDNIKKSINNFYYVIHNNHYPVSLYKQEVLKNITDIVQFVQNDLNYELTYFNDVERLMDITMSNSFSQIKTKYTNFVIELYEYYNNVSKENVGSFVYKAERIVKKRYNDSNLTLNEISSELEVTPNYLGKIFKEEFGISFSDFIEKVRMEKAMDLLKQTNLKIYEIADKCGYNDGQYFAKAFKRYTSKTPLEYRKNSVEKYTK